MVNNFISTLEKEISDKNVSIKVTKLPSYISCFIPEEEEIILIHKTASEKLVYKATSDENEPDISQISVTGNPLETTLPSNISVSMMDPFDYRESSEEKGHLPVAINQARKYLNFCNLKWSSHPYPLWILTDDADSILLSSYKFNGWVKRSWAVYKGLVSEIPNLESLQKRHAALTVIPYPLVSSKIRCTYVLQNTIIEQNPEEYYSLTKLEVSWSKLQVTPPIDRSTEATLMTKCKIGEGTGGLLALWRQLQLIFDYVDVISKRSKNYCTDNNILPSCKYYLEALGKTSDTENAPLKRVGKILKEPLRIHTNIDSNASLTDIVELFASNERPGMDVTDKLWFIFIECGTCQELSACFKQLFIELKKIGTSTPFVNSSNISSIANCLMGHAGANLSDPLECLVEIGLDKLKKEILFIFSKAQIATLNSLNIPKLPKFVDVPSSDWLSTVQKWLLWFCQVHCVLELLWNAQQAIHFPNESLLTLTSTALSLFVGSNSKVQSYEWLLANKLQEIKINIPISLIERRIESVPQEWVLTLNTELKGRKVQSIFYRGVHSPFPHILKEIDNSTIDETIINDDSCNYYWAELFSVSDEM